MSELREIVKIADIHVERIEMALRELSSLLPFDKEKVVSISTQNLLLTELLVNRFGKLQDVLGKKIVNEFLVTNGEFVDDLTMLDKINLLERLGVIESADLWMEMREARNHAAHEYPDHPEMTAQYLNKIVLFAPKLIGILAEIKRRLGI